MGCQALSSGAIIFRSGPVGLVRPRRERTDEDPRWHSEQLDVAHEKLPGPKGGIRQDGLSTARCNPRPAHVLRGLHSTIARESGISVLQTVQRAVGTLRGPRKGLIRPCRVWNAVDGRQKHVYTVSRIVGVPASTIADVKSRSRTVCDALSQSPTTILEEGRADKVKQKSSLSVNDSRSNYRS